MDPGERIFTLFLNAEAPLRPLAILARSPEEAASLIRAEIIENLEEREWRIRLHEPEEFAKGEWFAFPDPPPTTLVMMEMVVVG